MNVRSSPRSSLIAAAAFAALAFASAPAVAQTATCSSCTPTPTVQALTGLNVTGLATFNGAGAVVGNGNSFVGNVIKDGGASMLINVSHVGNGCPGGCGATQVNIQGSAFEAVRAYGASSSNTPGLQADMANAGFAGSSVGFVFNTDPITGTGD